MKASVISCRSTIVICDRKGSCIDMRYYWRIWQGRIEFQCFFANWINFLGNRQDPAMNSIMLSLCFYGFRIPILGSGSDFAPFISKVGVTCADIRYHYDESLGLSSYPLYHSVYETFHLVETHMDPTFKVVQFDLTWLSTVRSIFTNLCCCPQVP